MIHPIGDVILFVLHVRMTQVVSDCFAAAGADGQRGEELLELVRQEEAPAARDRPGHAQAAPAGRRGHQQPHGGVQRRRAHPVVVGGGGGGGAAHAATASGGIGGGELRVQLQPQQWRRERRLSAVAVGVQQQQQANSCGSLGCRSRSGVPAAGAGPSSSSSSSRRAALRTLRCPGGRSPVGVQLQHAELDGWPKPRGHHHRRTVHQQL
uniref:Uncharacterized protein n=1 Tax=Zea mays TaxID=4577 RepID=C0P5M3_MAIZE|nr:unknown [Zea mays]